MRPSGFHLLAGLALLLGGAVSLAQIDFGGGGYGGYGGRRGGGGGGFRGGGTTEYMQGNEPITPLPEDRTGVPMWNVDPQFKSDVFTFTRLRYTSDPQGSYFSDGTRKSGGDWKNDWPNADLNLSYRLQQMTSMKVSPEPIQIQITDPRLLDTPFAYIHQVGVRTSLKMRSLFFAAICSTAAF